MAIASYRLTISGETPIVRGLFSRQKVWQIEAKGTLRAQLYDIDLDNHFVFDICPLRYAFADELADEVRFYANLDNYEILHLAFLRHLSYLDNLGWNTLDLANSAREFLSGVQMLSFGDEADRGRFQFEIANRYITNVIKREVGQLLVGAAA